MISDIFVLQAKGEFMPAAKQIYFVISILLPAVSPILV